MKSYLAARDGNGVFIQEDYQMDSYLEKGYSIFEIDDDLNEKLIATPEDGFIVDRPKFGTVECRSVFYLGEDNG